MKHPIQVISLSLVAILLLATGFSIYSDRIVDKASALVEEDQDILHHSYVLVDELRQSRDELTRMARTFIATGDDTYAKQYAAVRDIRDGKAPRPEHYDRPYWDLVAKEAGPPSGNGAKIALSTLLKEEGFSAAEMEKLAEAQEASAQLEAIEIEAMNIARGLYPDEYGTYVIPGVPNAALARDMVHSDEYHAIKVAFSAPVLAIYEMMEARIALMVEKAMAAREAGRTQAQLALTTMITMILVLGGFLVLYLITPLRRLTAAMEHLGEGEGDTVIPCQKNKTEFGVLARQIAAYKDDSDKVALMGEEAQKRQEQMQQREITGLALQEEMDRVISRALSGEFDDRISLDTNDEATLNIVSGVNNFMSRIDDVSRAILNALSALGEGDIDRQIAFEGDGRFAEISQTGVSAQARLGTVMGEMAQSAEEARQSQQNVMAQQEVARQLQEEIDLLIDNAQRGDFSTRISIDTDDSNIERIANGLNNLMDRYDNTVSELIKLFTAFGAGDLTAELAMISEGRFGELKQSAETAKALLTDLIEQSTSSANEVIESVNRVREDSQTVAEAMQSQAASIEQTSAATVEMNKAIRDNSASLNGATDLTVDVAGQAATGSATVEQVIAAVEEIKKRSDKIADFVSIIENISFQTNLLALNASVEAARAGEAGRGFAVVASEVRNLSLKASDAATEIADLIRATTDSVETGVGLSRESGQALSEIADNVQKLRDAMTNISTTGDLQATSFQEIQQAIGEINNSTQRTAASADCTAEVADSLVETAASLKQTLSKFSTSSDPLLADESWDAA